MKFLSEYLLLPSGIIVVLAALAVVAWLIPRFRRLSVWLLPAGIFMYLVFGNGLTAFWLMSRLEFEYPASQDREYSARPEIAVVLTGFAQKYERVPITGHVNGSSGFRVMETVRIFNKTKKTAVIVSGSSVTTGVMRDLLIELGVPAGAISVDPDANSTHESAVHLRERLKDRRFFLVTSAGHMPRAMGVFQKQGLDPLPAPTDYLSSSSIEDSNILPNGRHLAISDLAIHEYLGLIWYRLLDRI